MLLHHFVAHSAQKAPETSAVLAGDEVMTHGELSDLVGRYANVCVARGVKPGDRVVIALENCIDLVAAYFGVMAAGAIAVPLAAGARNDRLATAIADCTPCLCIANEDTARGMSRRGVDAAAWFNPCSPSERQALAAASSRVPDVNAGDSSLAAIVYTSGSTGAARGVMLTHRNITANTRSIVEYLALTSADRVMCILPLYYVYGLSLLHTHMLVGGSIVLDNRFAYPNVVLAAMRERRVTGFAGVPSTFAMLLHRSDVKSMDFPDLRYVTQAGGAMPVPHIREWLDEGPRAPFFIMYGATEASARLTYVPPSDLPRKLGSIGRPIPGVRITVMTDGRQARPREIGELVAHGANIAQGYWGDQTATSRAFGDGGYRTGDLGYVDEEGFLFLVGRRQDMLKVGAHRVGAAEIENVLHQHPAVHQAAVIGIPHEILGEAPCAFVTTRGRSHLDERTLRAFCAARLPSHMVPHTIVFSRDLPLQSAGKIDKVTLRAYARMIATPGGTHASEDGSGSNRAESQAVHRQ